jgi:hypothetical protein
MRLLDDIAERHIAEAIARGDFDHLPGAGKPLVFEDDSWIPSELRLAYKILKNAGFVPPEVEQRREIADATKAIMSTRDEAERARAAKRLNYLLACLDRRNNGCTNLLLRSEYYERVIARMAEMKD